MRRVLWRRAALSVLRSHFDECSRSLNPPANVDRRRGAEMSNALYAILAIALVTSVGAGVAIHAMDSESPEHMVTVEGTVTAVEWNPHYNECVELTLTAA